MPLNHMVVYMGLRLSGSWTKVIVTNVGGATVGGTSNTGTATGAGQAESSMATTTSAATRAKGFVPLRADMRFLLP
jgi:hypothetical protein